MKNEETNYNDESTQYDGAQANSQEVKNDENNAQTGKTKKEATWRKVVFGTSAGILLGGATSFAATKVMAAGEDGEQQGEDSFQVVEDTNALSDGEVEIATGVSDDMSFGEAFATARAEVGSGGAFVWQGNVYSTFTAEEWDSMSAEEREEYNSHFNWSTQTAVETEVNVTEEPEEVEVVSVDHPEGNTSVEPETSDTDSDVEVLGVVYDEESEANIGAMTVDGQDVYLIDVDGGDDFDYMAVDFNQDGQITDEEIADISDQQISVSQFASHVDPMYASNDEGPDYIDDTANV